jgi:hypothetical protein
VVVLIENMTKNETNVVLKPADLEASVNNNMEIKMIGWDGSVAACDDIESLAMGTSGQGGIDCSYSQLVALFGEPNEGDGCKTQAEWTVATLAGIATIYDWKQGDSYHGKGNGTPVEQITEWSIGGHDKRVVEWVQKAIQATT